MSCTQSLLFASTYSCLQAQGKFRAAEKQQLAEQQAQNVIEGKPKGKGRGKVQRAMHDRHDMT